MTEPLVALHQLSDAEFLELLRECRRCLFYSARDLRKANGPESVLCELVEEEACVATLNAVLGDIITTDTFHTHPADKSEP